MWPAKMFCGVLALALTAASHAGTIIYVDDDAPPGGDGLSWATAYRFLQDALAAANGDVGEIRVAQGTYLPDRAASSPGGTGNRFMSFLLVDGVALAGGYGGLENGDDPDARDIDAYETILSGDLDGDDPPFDDEACWFSHPDPSCTDVACQGDVCLVDPSCCQSAWDQPCSALARQICDTPFDENSINVVRAHGTTSSASIDGFTIAGGNANEPSLAAGEMGGGLATVWNGTAGTATITRCTFRDNHATLAGGALFLWNFDEAMPNVVRDCRFHHNWSSSGIVSATASAPTVLAGCVIGPNPAEAYSAAVAGPLHATNCTFVGNRAIGLTTGAVSLFNTEATLSNCLIVGNRGDLSGGILNVNPAGSTSLTAVNCTFVGNTGHAIAATSGGITTTIRNCVVWDSGREPIVVSGPSAVTYTLVEGGFDGVGNISDAPIFVDPPSPGPDGEWGTVDDEYGDARLQPRSPGIDAGHNWLVHLDAADLDGDGDTGEFAPIDLAGAPRFASDGVEPDPGCGAPVVVDMGAYEHAGKPFDVVFADIDGSGAIDVNDLVEVILNWGACGGCCPADLNLSGVVDVPDLVAVILSWG